MSPHILPFVPPAHPAVPGGCNELFAASDAAWAGFMLAYLRGRILWVQDRLSARETGSPSALAIDHPLLLMRLSHPRDVLAAAEEALACRDLGAVVAELHGNPSALSFTATRRLAVRAEASGVPLWLVRHAATPDSSAMRDRWRIGALPSAAHPDDPAAPGDPCWRVELFRSRDKRPGLWTVRHERGADGRVWTADRLRFAALLPDREMAPDADGARGHAAR